MVKHLQLVTTVFALVTLPWSISLQQQYLVLPYFEGCLFCLTFGSLGLRIQAFVILSSVRDIKTFRSVSARQDSLVWRKKNQTSYDIG